MCAAQLSQATNTEEPGGEIALTLDRSKETVKRIKQRYADLPTLVKMKGKVKHVHHGDLDGRALTLFEHNHVTQAGSVTVPQIATVYVMAAPDWPTVKIAPRRFWSKLMHRFGRPLSGIQVELDVFNKAFWVGSTDEAFAQTLLSVPMQEFLLEKRTVRWRIRDSEVCVIYQGSLKKKKIGATIDRLRRFWSLVPPEMEHWTRHAPPVT